MTSPQLGIPVEHRYAEVNGIRMHYVEAGAGGETILFLHGFPEFWYSWRHQLEAFAPDYRVVAPDLRGYNETENVGPYDTGTLQEDVASLIRHLGEEKVHLVAHDWGGAVGWLLAINRPELLRSYVACNIPHPAMFARGIRSPRQLLRSWYVFFFQLPWLPEKFLARQRYQKLAKLLIDDTRPGTFTRDDIKAYLEAWRGQGLGGGVNWYRAALRQQQPLPDPPVVTVPTTLIWGEEDRALGKELTVGTDEFVPGLTIHYLPDTSHWVQQERPQEVNQFIREHLERVRRA